MRGLIFTDTQIVNILQQAESGIPISERCRRDGMIAANFYKWRSKYQ